MTSKQMEEILKWVVIDEETMENAFLPGTPDHIKQKYIELCKETDDTIEVS